MTSIEDLQEALLELAGEQGSAYAGVERRINTEPGRRFVSEEWIGQVQVRNEDGDEVAKAIARGRTCGEVYTAICRELRNNLDQRATRRRLGIVHDPSIIEVTI